MYKLQRTLYANEYRKEDPTYQPNPFITKEKKDIKSNNMTIKTYVQTIHKDALKIIKTPPKHRPNLTLDEKAALQDLRDDANIVIHPADKGRGVVIQSYQQYKCEIMRQLNDTSTYRKLTYDPVLAFQNKIQQLIDMGLQAGYIDSNTAKYLLVIHPIHPVLYTLPKIHKSSHNPP
ncbi:Hypothetical predicted protein, partial [Pelobates cultripes]